MKRRPKTKAVPADMDAATQRLANLAVRYPFRWFTQAKCGRICGFGDNVMTSLAALGAPIVGVGFGSLWKLG